MKLSRRTVELTTEKINEETIVYDERTHQAHCLNQAATFIWTNCDGRTSLEEIADRMPVALGLPADTAIVQMAVVELSKLGLLEGVNEMRTSSRRQMIRKLAYAGCAASVLPAVTSIIAPTPAMARSADTHSIDGSGRPPGSPGGETLPPDEGDSNPGGHSGHDPGGSGGGRGHGNGNPGHSNQGGNHGNSNPGRGSSGGNSGNSSPGNSNQGGAPEHSSQGGNHGNSNPGRGSSGGDSGNSNSANSNGNSGQNSNSADRRSDHGPASSSRGGGSGSQNR